MRNMAPTTFCDTAPTECWNGVGGWARRRRKSDWAGIGLGDAFKANLDYFQRLTAQRLFYKACRDIQRAVAHAIRLDEHPSDTSYQTKTKPQLGPCYTAYPGTLAAYAAIGLTGFLEFKAMTTSCSPLAKSLEQVKQYFRCEYELPEGKGYETTLEHIVYSVDARLALASLSREPGMGTIEFYRLFAATQHTLRFATVSEIVYAAVLFSDCHPAIADMPWLHPVTSALIRDLRVVSRPFAERLADCDPALFSSIGHSWMWSLALKIFERLVPHPFVRRPAAESGLESPAGAGDAGPVSPDAPPQEERLMPLEAPRPPAWQDPGLKDAGAGSATGDQLKNLAKEVAKACASSESWEDMPYDHVERQMGSTPFAESPLQGEAAEGHEIVICFNGEETVGGEIHDRPVSLSDDLPAAERLARNARPIADALRNALYPSQMEEMQQQRLRTSGSLDPSSLPVAAFSEAIFKRHRIQRHPDIKGKPVLLIACDGSGSLNRAQIAMLKYLAAGWLISTIGRDVEVVAGLYHSGTVRRGLTGPLVQWMYHPRKTPAVGRKDAIRALVSLPDAGTGVQSDALSLRFMIDQALQLARGRMIYLILVSDCCWNQCFKTERSGREEVRDLFAALQDELPGKLHTTLVALGTKQATGLEGLIEKIIVLPKDRLDDPVAVAEEIGLYVAELMKERRIQTRRLS